VTTIHWAVLIGGDIVLAVCALTCGWQIGRRAGLRQERGEVAR
jgi:hypothetical protein